MSLNYVTISTVMFGLTLGFLQITIQYINPAEIHNNINTLRTGDADLRFYITTVQDG